MNFMKSEPLVREKVMDAVNLSGATISLVYEQIRTPAQLSHAGPFNLFYI
jgi:hypothetical protein